MANRTFTREDNRITDFFEFYVTCPQGFERLLADELKRLRARRLRPLRGCVSFYGSREDGYRVCLWSRLASRVLRVITRVDAYDTDVFYNQLRNVRWEDIVGPEATIAVTARGTNDALRNTQFTALRAKDAVCDRLRSLRGARPNVSPYRPDVAIWVSLRGKRATVSIDYAGESLHRRGYRVPSESVEAPLKEALAAGMLVWGGWDALAAPALRRAAAERAGMTGTADAPAFADPVCGSGTLVLEAAMMAMDRAPGLSRDYWGFAGNADFDSDAFDALIADADDRFERGLENVPPLLGADIDPHAIEVAQANARRLGLADYVTFVQADCAHLPQVLEDAGIDVLGQGFLGLNPPYGMRLLAGGMGGFYASLAEGLRGLPDTWQMVAISPDSAFDEGAGFDAIRTMPVYNGAIETLLREYRLGQAPLETVQVMTLEGAEVDVAVSSDHALQFAGRLRKMAKLRRKWARRNNIHAYRIYDADLPDYAVSVDCFEDAVTGEESLLINEYQAPREIKPQKAALRFRDACAVAAAMLQVPEERLFTRVRRQDKGGSQYSTAGGESHIILVKEAGHPFEVDLSGYLDTGLFLDHRITRALVAERAAGTNFLNLFAYTGTASVYAAAGGAVSTTTVDMSQTYLDWARRNMERAGFKGRRHRFVRADVLSWIEGAEASRERYDLVFVDPPTFSNSKTMGNRTWDIQRDHVELLGHVRALLNRGGVIVFSGNLRSFKLDEAAISAMGLTITDVTAETIPEDFERNPRIHFCYLLENASAGAHAAPGRRSRH